ncbi:MAG: amidohydrolase family protein [Hyphomicrobiales bacterium]|nr:amidohydrolase family protein [Hyphomicrobiales bacterium]MDE2016241.1 amidohydrolase family protein [Hyphomicrobiales bacterium]
MIVDAHHHFWKPTRGDYGWLRPGVPTLAPLLRDFLPADYPGEAIRAGVAQTILVQAAPSDAETDFLLELADATPMVAGVVGWCDLADPASAMRIATLARRPKFKGVRPMLQDLPDVGWIATRPAREAVAALTDHGLRFDALVRGEHLPALIDFVDAHPCLPVVVDHAAKPPFGAAATSEEWARWDRGLAALAARPRVHCKVSGLPTEMPAALLRDPAATRAALHDVARRLLALFGPSRLMWGSDWPVSLLATDYGAWLALAQGAFAALPAEAKADIFGDTARRFYGLAERSPADGRAE